MTDNNKDLLLASTVLYSIAAFVLFISIFVLVIMMDIPEYLCGDMEDEGYLSCVLLCGPCVLVLLIWSMEVVAAVCSGLLYKQ